MATIFTRGFVRRSLPVLLALVLGLLVAPQPVSHGAFNALGTTSTASRARAAEGATAAVALHATTRTTIATRAARSGHSAPTAQPPAESCAPIPAGAGRTEQIPTSPRTLCAQLTVRALGSRAPPAAAA